MNTQLPTPNATQENVDIRMRTLRVVWLALMLGVVFYYVFSLVGKRSENVTPNNTLSLTLIGVGLSILLLSFLIKQKLLARAVDRQQPKMVQQAYIVALAMAEVPALLGMLDLFATGNPHYYLLMIISLVAELLHFPRREHVENAMSGTRI